MPECRLIINCKNLIYKIMKRLNFPVQLLVLLLNLAFMSVFMVGALTTFSTRLNKFIFGRATIADEQDRNHMLQTLGFYLGLLLFVLTTITMMFRVGKAKPDATQGEEPRPIALINRVTLNTLEQAATFGALYGALLLRQDQLAGDKVLCLAALFLVGRVAYAIGYLFGTYVKLYGLRSFGFGLNLSLNALLILQHLGFEPFAFMDQHFKKYYTGLI